MVNFKKGLLGLFRGSLFFFLSAVATLVVVMNNSVFLVSGSNIGVTLARTPMATQIGALIFVIICLFILVYRIIHWPWVLDSLVVLLLTAALALATHTVAWNYTEHKIHDIWLLTTVQQLATGDASAKTDAVNCTKSDFWVEYKHNTGAWIKVFRGFVPFDLSEKDLLSGCLPSAK